MPQISTPEADSAVGLSHKIRYGSSADSPLMIFVHGRAGSFDVMWAFRRCVPENFNIIAPQAPLPDEIGGYSWWEVDGKNEKYKERADQALLKLESFIEQALDYYSLQPQFMLAYGFSQGSGLLSLAFQKHPKLFQGVAILSGFVLKTEAQQASDFPQVFIAHGEQDEVVPIDKARAGADYLSSLGADVTFISDQAGHKVGTQGMKGLKEWTSQFARL